ncbi:putative glutamyl-tRNA amidotransferase subunit A [Coniochaeta sp. PMI_546]|nr:putative glutamyl-tRNA amidotransferase subunit A [Coniochaeta sp. PMI_546]
MSQHKFESLNIDLLRSGYEKGLFTPSDVVRAVFDRIDAYPDKAVWISLVSREHALADAERLTQLHANSKPPPPLFGIPFSVKDSIDVAGYPTTLACPSFAYAAERTAPVVQRIIDAGGIFIGKTNLDQFATGLSGHRSPYGTPRCVCDPDYISGGSSSGSAVSPTLGTVSTVGLVPACKTADCVTVIAKTVDDAKAAWRVMKGYDENDVYARANLPVWPNPWPTARTGLSFGVPPPELLELLSPDYAELFASVTETLSTRLGLLKASFDYSPFQSANDMLYGSSIVAQRLVAFDDYIAAHGLDDLHPVVKEIFAASSGFDAVRAYKDIFALQALRRRAEMQFRDRVDVLVVPSTVAHFTVAEMEERPLERNRLMGAFTHFVNLLDLCAVQVPAGTWRNGKGVVMPFGVTLIGQAGRDEELLDLGKDLMEVI